VPIDHSRCDHPRTSAGRRACRLRRTEEWIHDDEAQATWQVLRNTVKNGTDDEIEQAFVRFYGEGLYFAGMLGEDRFWQYVAEQDLTADLRFFEKAEDYAEQLHAELAGHRPWRPRSTAGAE